MAATFAAVSYFEIPVADMDRAVEFYETVFAITLERTIIDGNAMALFPEPQEGQSAITGALAQGDSYEPSEAGTRVYFQVTDINAVLDRVRASGGQARYPRTAIGELGWVAEFRDSEGNRVALHEPAP